MLSTVPLSLLDRSRTRQGEPDARALHRTVERAQRADRLGLHRFWVAEHHGVPGVTGTSPAVLAAAVASATERIRVGSGGVMLPNHQPFVVAEQFLMLEALFPGRIDLGLGRSLGFTAPVRRALRSSTADFDRFADDISELLDALRGTGPVTARPALPEPPPVFVLAMGKGLEVAAHAQLPTVAGGSLLRDTAALDAYREQIAGEVYVIVSLDIMVAESRERARQLLLPEAWAMVLSREIGEFPPLESVESILARRFTERQQQQIDSWLENAIYGDADSVRKQLEDLVARTGASEIMASTSTFDGQDLADADAALAALFRRTPDGLGRSA